MGKYKNTFNDFQRYLTDIGKQNSYFDACYVLYKCFHNSQNNNAGWHDDNGEVIAFDFNHYDEMIRLYLDFYEKLYGRKLLAQGEAGNLIIQITSDLCSGDVKQIEEITDLQKDSSLDSEGFMNIYYYGFHFGSFGSEEDHVCEKRGLKIKVHYMEDFLTELFDSKMGNELEIYINLKELENQ